MTKRIRCKFSLTEKYTDYLTIYSALFHVDNTASLPIQDCFPFDWLYNSIICVSLSLFVFITFKKKLQRDSSSVHSSVCSPSGVLYGNSISSQIYLGEKHRTYLYESRFFAENGTEDQFRHILTTEVHITFAVTVSFTAGNDIDTKIYSDSVNTKIKKYILKYSAPFCADCRSLCFFTSAWVP